MHLIQEKRKLKKANKIHASYQKLRDPFLVKSFMFMLFFFLFCTINRAQDLSDRLNIIENELETLKLQKSIKKEGAHYGKKDFSIGGYGEVKYSNNQSIYKGNQFDIHRFVLYTGYKFSDKISLQAEIEIEHADEIFLEFAYLDFLVNPFFSVRLGLQIIPLGIVNYLHEPTTFFSVNRPQTERQIIPSTWRENGLLLHGNTVNKIFSYDIGLFNGGNAQNFKDSSWIRSARQKGSQALATDIAAVSSFKVKPISGLEIALSYYLGNNGQGEILKYDKNATSLTPEELTIYEDTPSDITTNKLLDAKITTNLYELHLDYKNPYLSFRTLWARGGMNEEDTRAVNRVTGKNIGQEIGASYLELAFDLLYFSKLKDKHKLYVFVRVESLNTQMKTVTCTVGTDCVTDEFAIGNSKTGDVYKGNRAIGVISNTKYDSETEKGRANPANNRQIVVYGLAYYPHPNVVLKLDFENWNSKSKEKTRDNTSNNKIDKLNFSIAWLF